MSKTRCIFPFVSRLVPLSALTFARIGAYPIGNNNDNKLCRSSIKYDTNGKTMLARRWSILRNVVPSYNVTSTVGDNYRTLINFKLDFLRL